MENHFYRWLCRSVRQNVVVSKQLTNVMLLAVAVLFSVGAYAQDRVVTGKVTDAADGSALPGVTVQVKGTTKGTQTDASGTYKLNVAGNASLTYSFVGYATQTISVGNRSSVNVSLSSEDKTLEEVVVVGYGTIKKKDATGAVNAIGVKDFAKGVISSPEQLMQGRVAGVQITQSNGEPGGGINVRIRGTSSVYGGNQPLFVIDGVALSPDATSTDGESSSGVGRQAAKNPLNFMNPSDIESISVLKDASAGAIYGSRAANGVVIITTKKGKNGVPRFSYSTSYGVSNANLPSMMNGYELATFANDYNFIGGKKATDANSVIYTQDELDYFKANSQDWLSLAWKP